MPGSGPAAAKIFPCCTHNSVTRAVQIRGVIIATERITDSRGLKKRTQKKRNKNVKVDMWTVKKTSKKTFRPGWKRALTNK